MAHWEVEIEGQGVVELADSFNGGPILDDGGRRFLVEGEVDRIRNLRICVYANEHPPPHFIVKCSEGSCRFMIKDCSSLGDNGLKRYRRNIEKWYAKNRSLLITTWNSYRPSDCPVGEYRE